MTIVRAIENGTRDWTFGKGRNDYKKDILAVAQNINTRLYCFLGDCYFDSGAGIDWFNLLGAKDRLALNLAISATILNTKEVTGLLQLFTETDPARRFIVQYLVQTAYSTTAAGTFTFDTSLPGT